MDTSRYLNINLVRDELGRNTGGYIPKGSITLIEGGPSSGKSILSQRLAFGMLDNGHTVTYISTELNLLGFLNQMNSLGYSIYDKIVSEDLLFLSLLPQIGQTVLKKNMIFDLLTSKKVFENECVIVDLVSDFMVSNDITREDCFKISKLLTRIGTLGKTVILCADPELVNKNFLDMLRGNSDIYFFTEAKMVLGNMLRIINVNRFKMPAGDFNSAIPFKVLPGSGLSIEIASLS